MNTTIKICIYLLLFFVFNGLIITGAKQADTEHLLRMIIGLSGLIGLLWVYNRSHK
ncbi:DUF6903 family protein [Pseudoleptotrichia goodfellowii]|uniref:Uncharacterized protein n=2 Tax=Pseudoleptotrichia goodfellowii TaxID=157692 RepID=D0GJQ7_9FUSO|nr:hypothetical protein [Pseudoleptotrichia goodfellowii]EEY35580.1 hypothetical protein HMPREF0554_1047 [Pseudoleptotrichia goodfellowii F0264]BBM36565.1 hypothetical protein JCM16774_1509 [Pseudoleptotrichia goodfellowii]